MDRFHDNSLPGKGNIRDSWRSTATIVVGISITCNPPWPKVNGGKLSHHENEGCERSAVLPLRDHTNLTNGGSNILGGNELRCLHLFVCPDNFAFLGEMRTFRADKCVQARTRGRHPHRVVVTYHNTREFFDKPSPILNCLKRIMH